MEAGCTLVVLVEQAIRNQDLIIILSIYMKNWIILERFDLEGNTPKGNFVDNVMRIEMLSLRLVYSSMSMAH